MAERQTWYYEKLDPETGRIKHAPVNDYDGKITGRIVFGVKQWFDENPEERKRLGWIKHITHDAKGIEFNRQTQYLVDAVRTIDEYTVEDDFKVVDKSEERMRLEEIGATGFTDIEDDVMVFYGGEWH